MRYLFVFIVKCLSVILWVFGYLGFIIANLALSLWYFKPLYQLTWYIYSDGTYNTPREAYYDYLNMYTYKNKVKKKGHRSIYA